MPSSSRDFLRVAAQRLGTAEFLLGNGYNLDAMYIAGYTIECALKALLLETTPKPDRNQVLREISSGKQMHSAEALLGRLRDRNCRIPLKLVKRLRRSDWSTNLCYEMGRTDTGETRAFLKTAKAVFDWVEGELR